MENGKQRIYTHRSFFQYKAESSCSDSRWSRSPADIFPYFCRDPSCTESENKQTNKQTNVITKHVTRVSPSTVASRSPRPWLGSRDEETGNISSYFINVNGS